VIVRHDPSTDLTTIELSPDPPVQWVPASCLATVGLDVDGEPVDVVLAVPRDEVTADTWGELVRAVPALERELGDAGAFVGRVRW